MCKYKALSVLVNAWMYSNGHAGTFCGCGCHLVGGVLCEQSCLTAFGTVQEVGGEASSLSRVDLQNSRVRCVKGCACRSGTKRALTGPKAVAVAVADTTRETQYR